MAKWVIESLEYHGVMLRNLKIDRRLKGYNKPVNGYTFVYEPLRCIGYSRESEHLAIEDLKDDIEAFVFAHVTVGNLEQVLENLGFTKQEDGSWREDN